MNGTRVLRMMVALVSVTVAGVSAFAVPFVKITDLRIEDHEQGIVGFTYEVGDLGDKAYNLTIKAGVTGQDPVVIQSQVNVAAGAVTTNVDIKALFGEIGPGVTLYASLTEGPRCIRLWENGPCWAECNVGATQPEEPGYFFWWGDTVGYQYDADRKQWVSVDDSTDFSFEDRNCPTIGKDVSSLQSEGYVDSTSNLVSDCDAATVHLGAQWRMPTKDELDALVRNCTCVWTNRNGVYGRLMTGRGAYSSKSIFLPAAGSGEGANLFYVGSFGCYWVSTPCSEDPYCAWTLDFNSDNFFVSYYDRCYGQLVRPVLSSSPESQTGTQGESPVAESSATLFDVYKDLLTELLPQECPVELSVEDGNRLRLTLTGDIVGGLTLPADLGPVTIALDGWSVLGTNGVAGSESARGGDGGAAITIAGMSGVNAGETVITVKSVLPSDATGTPIGVASATGDVMVVSLVRNLEGRFTVHFYRNVDMGSFNCDVYKTTKIALRRIPKGVAYPVSARATVYPITKTLVPQRDFYVGLFEITGAQYERVMDASSASTVKSPKCYCSYSTFRSPTGTTQLDPPSDDKFIGMLLAGAVDAFGDPVRGFDLPTANQWEIAARAGSTGEFGAYLDVNGVLVEGTVDDVAVFAQTGAGNVVGSLRPNAWGFYDMCGGVGEWCRNSGEDVETVVKDTHWPFRGNDVTSWNIDHILSKYVSWTGYSGVNCGARLSCTLDVPESAWNGVRGGSGGYGNPPGRGGFAVADANGKRVAVTDMGVVCRDGATGERPFIPPTEMKTLAPFLHEVWFGADYACATDYAISENPSTTPASACSAVRKGNFLGRNFDFVLNDVPTFVVHMDAAPGRLASVGVAQQWGMHEDGVTNGQYTVSYDLVPEMMLDGINECGVAVEDNVVPVGDCGILTGTNPGAPDLNISYVLRYVLDHATNAAHGVELIRSRNLVGDISGHLYLHYMIADAKETYVVEVITNTVVARHMDIMTNFNLNWDNGNQRAISDANSNGWVSVDYPAPWSNDVDVVTIASRYSPGSSGVERFHILRDNRDRYADSLEGVFDLMRLVQYTKLAAEDADPFWFSEFSSAVPLELLYAKFKEGDEQLIQTMNEMCAETREVFANKEFYRKQNTGEWQTVHNTIYDIGKKMFRIAVQEDYAHTFDIWLVEPPLGSADRPWKAGEGVAAFTNGVNVLVVDGVGEVTSVPWAENADGITKLVKSEGVAGLSDIVNSLPDLTTVNGLTLDELAVAGMIGAVKAGFSAIAVDNGTAQLGVVVFTNGVLEVEKAGGGGEWSKAKIESVGLDKESGEAILTIPAPADKGFIILKSRGK